MKTISSFIFLLVLSIVFSLPAKAQISCTAGHLQATTNLPSGGGSWNAIWDWFGTYCGSPILQTNVAWIHPQNSSTTCTQSGTHNTCTTPYTVDSNSGTTRSGTLVVNLGSAGNDGPVTITQFGPPENLTVGVTGSGSVTSSPSGISCPGTCSVSFNYGTTVTLTASPNAGYSFTGWSGACSGTGACTFTMFNAQSVTATFTQLPPQPLTVSVTGSGSVTSSPSGIACPGTCSASFTNSSTVTLTASPISGNNLSAWSGACSGSNSTCSVVMSTSRSVSATFAPNNTLTTIIGGSGNGTVTSSPAGINCPGTCSSTNFTPSQTVTLTATPAPNFAFVSWAGDCTGTSSTAQVIVSANRTCTAQFGPKSGTRIQTSGGTAVYKFYTNTVTTEAGVRYTVQATVQNNGSSIAQVSSNFNSVNIAPGTTQNVVLNFTGNGTGIAQIIFDTVTNISDPLDVTVWNPYVAKVADGVNLLSANQLSFVGWTNGPGATVTLSNDATVTPEAFRIQTSSGTTAYKYYATGEISQDGVPYTVQVTVRNNGPSMAQVSSNLNFVNIPPGTTQNVVLNFTGNGTSAAQLIFDTVTNTSDPLDLTVWNPYIARVTDGTNLLSSALRNFQGWATGPGATATVTNLPNDLSLAPQGYRIQSSGGTTVYKYYATPVMSEAGVPYTLRVSVRNNGSSIAQVSSNFNSVNIAPGATQNVVLNFTGNGTSYVQMIFDTVTNVSDPLDLTVWNPYIAKVADGVNLMSPSQLTFANWATGTGASVTAANDPTLTLQAYRAPQGFRIQTSGGTTQYKYYANTVTSENGVAYTLRVSVHNNGSAIAQVSSNFNSVNIAPGTTQNVVLNFTGNGTSIAQMLFDTVTSTSDPLDITVWNPYIAKVSDGINLLTPDQAIFAGWTPGTGATVKVANDPSPIP